jgi:hypothetical protein
MAFPEDVGFALLFAVFSWWENSAAAACAPVQKVAEMP